MTADAGADAALDLAARRLDRAITLLEQRLTLRLTHASAVADTAVDNDRAKLAAELDASRARERDLAQAGAEASGALARAMAAIRAALGEDGDA